MCFSAVRISIKDTLGQINVFAPFEKSNSFNDMIFSLQPSNDIIHGFLCPFEKQN